MILFSTQNHTFQRISNRKQISLIKRGNLWNIIEGNKIRSLSTSQLLFDVYYFQAPAICVGSCFYLHMELLILCVTQWKDTGSTIFIFLYTILILYVNFTFLHESNCFIIVIYDPSWMTEHNGWPFIRHLRFREVCWLIKGLRKFVLWFTLA